MPRMIRIRFDCAPWREARGWLRDPPGTRRDDVIVECPVVVHDPQRPLHAFFHQHVGGPEGVVDLVEASVVGDRPVAA